MRKEKKLLISELQARLVPFFVEHGFQQTPLSGRDRKSREVMLMLPLGIMKRTRADKLDLLEIQLHPRRTTFVLAFGRVPSEGVSSPWPKPSQAEVGVEDLPENCRLYANRFSMTWFGLPWLSFGRDAAAAITKAIGAVIELYPEVEEYFRSGVVGPHVKCIRYSRDASGKLTAEIRSV
jgi:hypothetical protein